MFVDQSMMFPGEIRVEKQCLEESEMHNNPDPILLQGS